MALLLAGCASAYLQGRTALRQERYGEAASLFAETVAQDPNRVDALVGLGISRYKLGALNEAVDALRQAVGRAPGDAQARLYLALSHLGKADDGEAQEQFRALLDLRPERRLAALVDRALRLLQSDRPLSDAMREYVAASLEAHVACAEEVEETRRQARLGPYLYEPPFGILYLSPRGRLFYCY
jgi:tetratricopeptide (TPR) repeat protein